MDAAELTVFRQNAQALSTQRQQIVLLTGQNAELRAMLQSILKSFSLNLAEQDGQFTVMRRDGAQPICRYFSVSNGTTNHS